MSSLPFLQVGPDFLLPPKIETRIGTQSCYNPPHPPIVEIPKFFPPPRMNWPREIKRQRLIEFARSPFSPIIDADFSDEIFDAVKANDRNRLLNLLKKRKNQPSPLSANNEKWTAMHLAASRREYKECLELLMQYDTHSILVDKNDQTKLGETALHIACRYNCPENALVLLQNDWDAETKTFIGDTPLHIAAYNGYKIIVQSLLTFGANIESKNSQGCTPLHLAAMSRHGFNVIPILMANGANIRSTDCNNNLPLHLACRVGTLETAATFETVRLLLEYDSTSLNDKNSEGLTPFMLAVGNYFDVNCIQYLLEKGAKLDIYDNQGNLALDLAASQKNIQKFSFLVQSTSVDLIEQMWVLSLSTLTHKSNELDHKFVSLTCLTIIQGFDHLNVLLELQLPTSILQMPSLRQYNNDECVLVFSPLAYLFYHFVKQKKEAFDNCLDLLLKHKITVTDEFRKKFQPDWQIRGIHFINPLSILMCNTWPYGDSKRYFDLLIENNVTTDYCLQSYHDTNEPFWTFNEYKRHYGLVIYAVEKFDVAAVKLLISNSVILEPDVLCNYLIIAYSKSRVKHAKEEMEKARDLYQYLIQLKPVYYKWYQPFNQNNLKSIPFMPAAEKIPHNIRSRFCRSHYIFQKSPIFAMSIDYKMLPLNAYFHHPFEPPPFPYIPATEEFGKVTLKQLCRTAIRHQLREPTLEDNLRNFRNKILALPLPNELKEYLLFKDTEISGL